MAEFSASRQSSSVSSTCTPPPKRSKSSTRRHRGHKYKTKKRHKERINSSSDSSSSQSSSISSPKTQPPKRSKSSMRRHRGHKYKTKKRHKESGKRKNRGSSSALSHDSTESTSSDSDHETAKEHDKKRKQESHKHSQSSTPQLTMADHHKVSKFLRDLDNDQLIGVGVALGLYRPNLKRMKDLLGDMVSAWLREDDNVTVASGSPSWTSLATTLQDIGHKGIASKIRKGPMQAAQTATPLSPEMSSTFSRYRNYLKSFYNTNPVARDDKLSIAPCSEFISLALVKKDKSIYKDITISQSTLYGSRDQISAHKIPIELDDILTSDSKFVLVEGLPGIGKSTLSWELCRKWDSLKCLQHYCIVLLLKLREGRVQNASSLNELFYHRDRALCESVVSEVLRYEGEGVLLILDGFDEMPASVVRNKESLIMEIISGTCIPRATRLVTSRPSALYCTKCFPQEFRHVEIVGFTDESKEKFANIAFKSEPSVIVSAFKKFIFSNPIIKSLMYIPVNCAILAQSFKDIMRSSKQVPKTTTQLYSMLTPVLIRRHLIAIGMWDEDSKVPSDLKDLPEDVKGDLERVSKLAYTGLFKEDVQLVFTDSDVGEGFQTLGLLSKVKEMYVCEGARTSYSFLHLSIQEFLAALHVSCHQELVEEALAETLRSYNRHLDVFGLMLTGLVGIDLYIKYLRKCNSIVLNEHTLYTCHCFYETQNNMSRNVFDNLIYNIIVDLSTPMDMYVFGYFLAYISHKWSRVTISSSIDMLVSSLADHASGKEVLGSIETLVLHCAGRSSSSFSELKDLPQCLLNLPPSLLNSIKELVFKDDLSLALLERMPVLQHLQEITIIIVGKACSQNEYYYEYINKCPNLKTLGVHVYGAKLSESVVNGLTKAIASSSTIEVIKLGTRDDYEYRIDSLAQAALSCPSLKKLTTFFTFIVSSNASPMNLQHIHICQESVVMVPTLFDCLYSIASACKILPLKEIKSSLLMEFTNDRFRLSLLPCECVGDYYDCISLLNVCLHHHWQSMEKFELPFSIPCTQFHLSCLSRALRSDPDTSQLKLRRSKSLSDLVCLKTLDEHPTATYPTFKDVMDSHTPVVKKTESCPDLVGIQLMHPLITGELFRGSDRCRPDGFSLSDLLHLTPHNPYGTHY